MATAPKKPITRQEAQASLERAKKVVKKRQTHKGQRGPSLKLDDIVKALYKHNGLVTFAAKELGCSPLTINEWMHGHEALREVVRQCRMGLVDEAEKALFSNIKRKKEPSVFFTLKCLGKDRGFIEQLRISLDEVQSGTVKPQIASAAAKVIDEL